MYSKAIGSWFAGSKWPIVLKNAFFNNCVSPVFESKPFSIKRFFLDRFTIVIHTYRWFTQPHSWSREYTCGTLIIIILNSVHYKESKQAKFPYQKLLMDSSLKFFLSQRFDIWSCSAIYRLSIIPLNWECICPTKLDFVQPYPEVGQKIACDRWPSF